MTAEREGTAPAPTGPARLRHALPYLLLGAAAAGLYALALEFQFPRRPGTLGPDAWPRGLALLLFAVCAAKAFAVIALAPQRTPGETLAAAADGAAAPATHPLMLAGGMAATVGYVAAVRPVGFFLCTAAYLALFLWIGGYRRHGVIAATSILGSLLLMVVFMKVVYVSLPLGEPPFVGVMLTLMDWLGIR